MQRSTRSQWRGSFPVFIVTLQWSGKTFYLSNKPAVIDKDGEPLQLHGGLVEDPPFESSLSEVGFNVASISTPIAAYLNNTDLSLQLSYNNTLENAIAELSYVLVSDNSIQSYQDRTVLLKGLIKEPIIAHRDRSNGYFEASIESEVINTSLHNSSMGQGARISPEELSDLVNPTLSPLSAIQDANYILNLLDVHKEKILPIIFGASGVCFDKDYNEIDYGATPAYVLSATSGTTNDMYLCIAPHDVEAVNVKVYDDLGNWRVEDVEKWIRNDGRVFSFVHFTSSSGSFQNPVDDENAKYFISWYDGGGLISPSDNKAITGAGDVCLWCLEQANQQIDYQSWEGLKQYLNTYKIAGYINDTEITPIEFLENEIIPLLPISVIHGASGMKPVLDLFSSGYKPNAMYSIVANEEFSASSGIIQNGDTSSLINDFTLLFCFDMKQQAYQAKQSISGKESIYGDKVNLNDLAIKSFNKYGPRSSTKETSYVHDFNTASLICFDTIRNNSFPKYIIDYDIASRYGWLEIGDIFSLTDDNFNLNNELVQVIKKSWQDTYWAITIRISPEGIK